jgi:hypothetical protein
VTDPHKTPLNSNNNTGITNQEGTEAGCIGSMKVPPEIRRSSLKAVPRKPEGSKLRKRRILIDTPEKGKLKTKELKWVK